MELKKSRFVFVRPLKILQSIQKYIRTLLYHIEVQIFW